MFPETFVELVNAVESPKKRWLSAFRPLWKTQIVLVFAMNFNGSPFSLAFAGVLHPHFNDYESRPHHSHWVDHRHPREAPQVELVPCPEQRLRPTKPDPQKQTNPKLLARPKPGSATTINWWILVGTATSPKKSNQTGFRFRKHVASVRSNPSYGSLRQEWTSVSRSHECTSMKSQCYICWSNVGLLVKCPFCFTSLRLDLFSFILSRLW